MKILGVYLRAMAPFADQPLIFPSKSATDLAEVHFFVGQNGTGKTRLLSLLAAACGNPYELEYRSGGYSSTVLYSGERDGKPAINFARGPGMSDSSTTATVEKLMTDIARLPLSNPLKQTIGNPISYAAMAFRAVPDLEDQKISPMGQVSWGKAPTFLVFNHHQRESAQLCQALANLKVRVGIVAANPADRATKLVAAFDRAIKAITGEDLTITVEYKADELKLAVSWNGETMLLRQLPDGLRSIIGWLASCICKLDVLYQDSPEPLSKSIILLLDEPDAHLHPAWQRKLIPAIQQMLPNAQIFIATHSPFVISSVNEGWIHVFNFGDDRKVRISAPKECPKGDTYIDVVEDVLGIHERFDVETEGALAKFRALRDVIRKNPIDSDITALNELAQWLAKRGETLRLMMGRELAQLEL